MQTTQLQHTRARNITILATFLAFMGIGVVDPILPTIAEQIGANHWQVEMLFTAYILTMSILMIPAGFLSTRVGDKRMVMLGLGIVTVFATLCAVSDSILQLSLFRAGWGMGNAMFFATAMTLLISFSKDASEAIGLYEAAIGLGMAGGPLVGGILGGLSWRYPFLATALLILIAFILVIIYIPKPQKTTAHKTVGRKELFQLLTHRPFMLGAMSAMCYYYGFFVVLAYSPLVLHLSAIQLGFVFFGWGLCLAYGSAVLAHQLERRWSVKHLLQLSVVAYSFLLLLLFFVQITWLQITLVIISGLVAGLNNALFTSYVLDISPYERSITSGVYNFVRWLGAALAPICSGVIGHMWTSQSPFLVAVFIGIIAIGLLLLPQTSTDQTLPTSKA